VLEATSIVTGLSGRYASALYELARDSGALPRTEEDLAALKRAIEGSEDLRRLIKSPVFAADSQWKAMEAIAQRMQLATLTQHFLGVIIHNRRLFALPNVMADFFKLSAYYRDELSAQVVSATALSDAQLARLKAGMKSALGRTVNVMRTIDPDLLGGLIVRVGSIMIDSSIRTQLANLQVAMREVN